MIRWKRSLEQFITPLPIKTSSFLAIRFHPPGCPSSVHISLYLPTSGKEPEFVKEITNLSIFLEETLTEFPSDQIYIRGDSNVNANHSVRMKMLRNFLHTQKMFRIPIGHRNYHHFLGNGQYDSNIDIIMQSRSSYPEEKIEKILCEVNYPMIESHHDIILSSFQLPLDKAEPPTLHAQAPTIENTRKRIIWCPETIPDYQTIISDNLLNLRTRWMNPSSKTSVSLLLELTSEILSSAASSTNKSISLSKTKKIT